MLDLTIVPEYMLDRYKAELPVRLEAHIPIQPTVEFTNDYFGFYTSVSAVFSSKIEGEGIELDSYLKHRFYKVAFTADYTRKTDDLFRAYQFARENPLNIKHLFKAHKLLSANLLRANARGKIRKNHEVIIDKDGRIEYVAAGPDIVEREFNKLFHDIDIMLNNAKDMDLPTKFYFASMIHLVFLKIHPFEDGNGRMSRLLEKWFLASVLGESAWYIQSERYYHTHLAAYYKNVHLGLEYETVDYHRSLPLLLMLPASILG
jgi:Fic family protein